MYLIEKKTILLVEDETLIALSNQQMLAELGYNVIIANSGEKAIEFIKKNNIDLILMDIDLGKGIDGIDTASIILKGKDIPIIFLTNHIEKEYIEKAEQITSYGYITKNSLPQAIDASIKMAFRLYETRNEFKEIFNATNEAIFIDDATNGKMIKANRRSIEMYGFSSEEEILNGNIGDISANIFPFTEVKAQELIKKAIDGEPQTFEWLAKKKNGEVFWVEVSLKYTTINSNKRVIAVVRDINERKKSEEKIKSLLKEKEILLKEVHHRIKNNMNTIASLIFLHANKIDNADTKDFLLSLKKRINTMAVLYEKLYNSPSIDRVSIKEYLTTLVGDIISTISEDKKINISFNVQDVFLDTKILFPVGIIVNELITNSIKYAFQNVENCQLDITFKVNKNKAKLIISDNGCGISEEQIQQSNGFGFELIKLLTSQLNGSFSIENSNGSHSKIEFYI
ncbi:MAG: histidine kinase dimerization/phosphoacceptor domain -containing protein [Brevinematales bacterium]